MKTLNDLVKLPSAIVVVFECNNDGQISITRKPLTQVEDEWPYDGFGHVTLLKFISTHTECVREELVL